VAESRCRLAAVELAEGYRRRWFSPVEVVGDLCSRIESLNPQLNAFTTPALDQAMHAARQCEQSLRSGDERPLLGIPVAVKDLIDTAGLRTTYGSSMFDTHVPRDDALVVKRLRQAGAIIIGKTATHEFAWGFTSDNPHFGPVRNPWDKACVAGGSSGGSAAAVAADMVPVAIGTDTGGSIRVPASFCGVAGLKPTYGRVSSRGVFPLAHSLDHVGAIARDPRDLHLVLQGMQGGPRASVAVQTCEGSPGSLSGVRIGISGYLDPAVMPVDMLQVWSAVRDVLLGCGATLMDLEQWPASNAANTFPVIQLAEALRVHRRAGLYPGRLGEYGRDVRERLELATEVTLEAYLDAVTERARITEAVQSAMQPVDLVLSPCAATTAPPIASECPASLLPLPDLRPLILGYTAPQNLTGLPACAVRAGFDARNMPVGIQFTGRAGAESLVLRVATAFWLSTPGIQARVPDPAASSARTMP